MMRFNVSLEEIKEYIKLIYERINRLNPLIADCKKRDSQWLHAVIDYHTSQGYGLAHELVGFDGYVTCLEVRQKLELEILEEIAIRKLEVKSHSVDLNAVYQL